METMMRKIAVVLSPQLEILVQDRATSGRNTSASDVVCEALGFMDEQDQMLSARLEQLRQNVSEGLKSGPATEWDANEVKREGRARKANR
jgi:antitoxin ParD1/3/4